MLVLEDSALIAGLVCDTLRGCGVEPVGPVPKVEDAAKLLQTERVDGAILDINLKGASCYTLCVHLAAWNIPFLFLTGGKQEDIPAEFRDRPFMQKPLEPDALCKVIGELFPSD